MSPDPRPSSRRRLRFMAGVVGQANRALVALILVTLVLSAVSGALQSLALKWIIDAATTSSWSLALVAAGVGAVGAGLLGSAGRATGDAEHILTSEVGLQIDRRTLELTSSMPGIAHLERPDYLDRLSLVRGGGPDLMRAVFTLTRTASLAISMVSSLWLLATVHPVLVLTPLAAVPTAILVPRSERHVDRAKVAAAERQRAATQLHGLFLAPGPAMELRVFGAADRLDAQADRLWNEVSDLHLRGAVRSAALASVGWTVLTAGYVAALWFTAWLAIDGRATAGDVVLVSQLALLIRGNVARTADAARHAAAALRTADRFLWLEDLHADQARTHQGQTVPPARLTRGLAVESVSFTYPGEAEPALRDVSLELAAGTTVAVVGENGAGKTTLVKLLTGMYRPDHGRILVDGVDLNQFDLGRWRQRLGGTFQDFVRLETKAGFTVGVGNGASLDPQRWDQDRVETAVDQGDARRVVDGLPHGLDTPLGKTYRDGHELSGGQWQRLAIARGLMPAAPLCLVLDEPTAALDPVAEQALYQRYQRQARESDGGGAEGTGGTVTVLISHRFSSVRMADMIVVFAGGRVAEQGSHDELMALDGHYAAMFTRQAAAYQD